MMHRWWKQLRRLSANALGWRFRRDQLLELGFEIAQFLQQPVVFPIAYRRCGEHEILAVMLLDRSTKLGNSLLGLCDSHAIVGMETVTVIPSPGIPSNSSVP